MSRDYTSSTTFPQWFHQMKGNLPRYVALLSATLSGFVALVYVELIPAYFTKPILDDPMREKIFCMTFFFVPLWACSAGLVALIKQIWTSKISAGWWMYPCYLIVFCCLYWLILLLLFRYDIGLTAVLKGPGC